MRSFSRILPDTSEEKKLALFSDKLAQSLFKVQRPILDDVIDPKIYRIAVLCPRRSGKSEAFARIAIIKMLEKKGSNIVIVGLSKPHLENIYLQKFQHLFGEGKIAYKYNRITGKLTVGDRAITLAGGATPKEIEKFRGPEYDMAVIDEAASFDDDRLRTMIDETISPALRDRNGTLIMGGTPGYMLKGYFWEVSDMVDSNKCEGGVYHLVCNSKNRDTWVSPIQKSEFYSGRPQWMLHSWTMKDNEAAPQNWERACEEKIMKGWPDDNPVWMRESLGKWAADPSALVFSYARMEDSRCDWTPDYTDDFYGLSRDHSWRYVLGIDLGSDDPTAFVVAAWAPTSPDIHVVYEYKEVGMSVSDIVDKSKELEELFGVFDKRIIDTAGAAKNIATELTRRHGVAYNPPDSKQHKLTYILLLNNEFNRGRVKLDPKGALAAELRTCVFTPDGKDIKRGCEDHLVDALRYIQRYCYNYIKDLKDQKAKNDQEEKNKCSNLSEEEKSIQIRRQLIKEASQEKRLIKRKRTWRSKRTGRLL